MNHCISRLSRAVLLALPWRGARSPTPRAKPERHLLPGRRHGSGHRDRRPHLGRKQLAAQPGSLVSPERANLSMQLLPAARIKTFSLDGQTTDSAPSMAAYMTGVKMRNEVISMSADTVAVDGAGKQYVSGEDSTCPRPARPPRRCWNWPRPRAARSAPCRPRVGHATPATTYAHVCNRNGYNTIAEQSTPGHANYNTRLGDGIDVLLGGGQRNYLPAQPGQQAHRRRQSGDGLPGQGLYLRRYGHRAALNPAATGNAGPVLAKRDGL